MLCLNLPIFDQKDWNSHRSCFWDCCEYIDCSLRTTSDLIKPVAFIEEVFPM